MLSRGTESDDGKDTSDGRTVQISPNQQHNQRGSDSIDTHVKQRRRKALTFHVIGAA